MISPYSVSSTGENVVGCWCLYLTPNKNTQYCWLEHCSREERKSEVSLVYQYTPGVLLTTQWPTSPCHIHHINVSPSLCWSKNTIIDKTVKTNLVIWIVIICEGLLTAVNCDFPVTSKLSMNTRWTVAQNRSTCGEEGWRVSLGQGKDSFIWVSHTYKITGN